MAGITPNEGAKYALECALNKTVQGDLTLRLFENNYTPIETSTYASFTEATFSGYAAKTLTGANWTVTNADPAVATYSTTQTFTSNAAQTKAVYGYYITKGVSNVVFAELFTGAPYNIVNNGDVVNVTLQITAD